MTYEREGLLLKQPTQPAIDQELFGSFEAARGSFAETYKDLQPSDEKSEIARDAWTKGENADLTADTLNDDELLARVESLKQWKRELISDLSVDPDVKELYRWKVNEDIANINMLIASSKGDMRNFRRWNEFIYGKPDEDIYRGALDWVAHDAEGLVANSQHASVVDAASTVLALLDGKRGYRELLVPEPETFEQVREDHISEKGYYGLLLAGVTIPEGKVTKENGDPILKHIIAHNLQSPYKLADSKGASWGVSHSTETVERPAEYNMPAKRFVGLGIGHEIGSHELERVNGLRGPIKLASIGFDRYESGNEGRAVIREVVPYETFDEFGKLVRFRDILRRHIAISYASGVGEEEPKSSSDVFALMNAIDTMYQAKLTPENAEETAQKAKKKTTDLLERVLKGTDGTGGAYLKDKVYLEGFVANWLEAALHGPEVISNGDLGKYAINIPRHIKKMQKVGLLPDNE